MKKYIKNTNLVPVDNKIKIYSQVADIPQTLDNEIVIVDGIGVFKCNGSSFSSTDYPELYSLLGTTTLPDYRECALRGATSSIGTFSNDAMGSHSHTTSNTAHTHSCSRSSHDHCYWRLGPVVICKTYCNNCSIPKLYSATSGGATVSTNKAICGNTSGFTVGASPWASTVTRAREIGVRFIICAGE